MEAIVTRRNGRETLASSLAARLGDIVADSQGIKWPSTKYQNDILGFAREVCGIDVWKRQEDILLAAQTHKRVTVRSGHKIGKSLCAAIIALWFYCSFPRARVIFTSATAKQIDDILWSELKRIIRNALIPIDGEIHKIARSGLEAGDRKIWGFTAQDAESAAGFSGHILFIADEASGIDDQFFEVISGNMAGAGSRLIMFSNPTRTEGEFFESHEGKKEFYHCIAVSSEETPNAVSGHDLTPGLASRDWIEERRREWGEDSPFFKVRVKGEFVKNEEGKIINLHYLALAEERWFEIDGDGQLYIGVDPAGDGMDGDETAIAIRRGQKIFRIDVHRGLSVARIVEEIETVAKEFRRPEDHPQIPIVVVDAEGSIGSELLGLLNAKAQTTFGSFRVHGVRCSKKAVRQPEIYGTVRDELWACLGAWLRGGGAVPTDVRLSKELHAPQWDHDIQNKSKATQKDDLRKKLDGRSPDRADACALAVWTPADHTMTHYASSPTQQAVGGSGAPPVNPYARLYDSRGSHASIYGRTPR